MKTNIILDVQLHPLAGNIIYQFWKFDCPTCAITIIRFIIRRILLSSYPCNHFFHVKTLKWNCHRVCSFFSLLFVWHQKLTQENYTGNLFVISCIPLSIASKFRINENFAWVLWIFIFIFIFTSCKLDFFNKNKQQIVDLQNFWFQLYTSIIML